MKSASLLTALMFAPLAVSSLPLLAAEKTSPPKEYPAAPPTDQGRQFAIEKQPLNLPVKTDAPAKLQRLADGNWFADFSRTAYGWLEVRAPENATATSIVVRVGEKLTKDGRVDRAPGGSINYRELTLMLKPGAWARLEIPTKKQHTHANVVKMPESIGEVTPFRAVEIEGLPFELKGDTIRREAVFGGARATAEFSSSDQGLVDVWNLCRWTTEATSAFGIYIDGERERLAYEADAFINQQSHYAVAPEYDCARNSFNQLLQFPTWPTEWAFHMIFIAHADYEWTGSTELAAKNFDTLKKKLLLDRARPDGLLKSYGIIDWPDGERDGYGCGMIDPKKNHGQIGPEVNTVVNAFHIESLKRLADLADATDHADDAKNFRARAARATEAFHRAFLDAKTGTYRDGEGCDHVSLHANLFPLAFGLVPAANRASVIAFIKSRGMACSVYGAQYLLDGLFENGEADYALSLLTASGERSWRHMIDLGSTMTLEAWDAKFKPNLTWNHAWGAAPANVIARDLIGIRPASPGFRDIVIQPRIGKLAKASLKMPTPRGDVSVTIENVSSFRMKIETPQGTTTRVILPRPGKLQVDGKTIGEMSEVTGLTPGAHWIEVN